MKHLILTLTLAFLLTPQALPAEDYQALFNGKDLTGWDGNPDLWSVENGAITGRTKGPEQLKHNQFLIWRGGALKNFELSVKIRAAGNNSGIQYRSKELPDVGQWSVGGYQCDVHPKPANNAMIYHERGRGIVVQNGQSVVADPDGARWIVAERDPVDVDIAQWHEYKIVAKGNHISHYLDGSLTIELHDYDETNRALSGLLAFQVHRGPAMEVQIKDVRLRVLPEGGVTPFAKADLPSDAQKIEKRRPAAAPRGRARAGQTPRRRANNARKRTRGPNAGARIGQNLATPIERIKVPDGFEVELLYSVPGEKQGSWVALCPDDQGRIYASDQYGVLYRFEPPAAGQALDPEAITKVPVEIRAINGMVWVDGALYAGVNDYERLTTSGFYKISDTDGDGELDKAELLRAFQSKSDHGVHAVVPTPDGKYFYLITGNNAIIENGPIEGTPNTSPVAKVWGDDHLLPRMPDGRGHNRHVLSPGGIVYRVSRDGKEFEIFASGFRNIYGGALHKDGELFTYDADMEYDFNTPWYRPTRVNHVVSGGEYGWRNGAGKYPEFYPDNLPATLNIGPGSPTGTRFGYGARFPSRYQEAFYILDWSWGKVYAVHLEENGSSYIGTKEEFVTGAPLPVTDLMIHPDDGAMYFAIGGRKVQSGLYRVTYAGEEDTAPVDMTPDVTPLRQLRHDLEAYHGKQAPSATEFAWPHLDHQDRYIRWAARIVLEHQPSKQWANKALEEKDPGKRLAALLALARLTGVAPAQRPETGQVVNEKMRDQLFASLLELDFGSLSDHDKLAYVRLAQIVLVRFGDPDQATLDTLAAKLNPALPDETFELNWLLCETLAYLQVPETAAKGMALIASAGSQEPQMEYARSLRVLKKGWTPALRERQLEWFLKAANYRGGASFGKFIEFIKNDTLATFTDEERKAHAELLAKKPEVKSAIENVGAIFAGRTPTMWTLDELSAAAKEGLRGRDYDTGRKMFSAAACYACHRFGSVGGMNGPDLTGAGGRYSPHDLLDQIINPSKEINEQFAPVMVTLEDGNVVSGVVVNLNGDTVVINTDLSDPNQRVNIDRKKVKEMEVSTNSPMPPMLLNMLTQEEVLDLLAYILSGGDQENAMFE